MCVFAWLPLLPSKHWLCPAVIYSVYANVHVFLFWVQKVQYCREQIKLSKFEHRKLKYRVLIYKYTSFAKTDLMVLPVSENRPRLLHRHSRTLHFNERLHVWQCLWGQRQVWATDHLSQAADCQCRGLLLRQHSLQQGCCESRHWSKVSLLQYPLSLQACLLWWVPLHSKLLVGLYSGNSFC